MNRACTHDVSSCNHDIPFISTNMHKRNKRVTSQCMSGVPQRYIYIYERTKDDYTALTYGQRNHTNPVQILHLYAIYSKTTDA